MAKQERRVIACPAVAGCVVLFESWQRHTVPPNAGEDERMSISFNYHWRYEKPTTGHLEKVNDGSWGKKGGSEKTGGGRRTLKQIVSLYLVETL